nr:hypothetical protein CFP56_67238 [Quercus suber]
MVGKISKVPCPFGGLESCGSPEFQPDSHSQSISLTASLSSPSLAHGLTLFSLSHSRTQPQALTSVTVAITRSHRRPQALSPSVSSSIIAGLKIVTGRFLHTRKYLSLPQA